MTTTCVGKEYRAVTLERDPLAPLLLKWLKEVKGLLKLDVVLQRVLRIIMKEIGWDLIVFNHAVPHLDLNVEKCHLPRLLILAD